MHRAPSEQRIFLYAAVFSHLSRWQSMATMPSPVDARNSVAHVRGNFQMAHASNDLLDNNSECTQN